MAYDASPYVELAVLQEDIGEVSARAPRGADVDVDLSMVRDPFGEFVVVGRYTAWDLWRYSLGVELQEVDRRLGSAKEAGAATPSTVAGLRRPMGGFFSQAASFRFKPATRWRVCKA